MKSVFFAQSKDGRFKMEEYTAKQFADDLKKNNGARYKVERVTPESLDQRRFFEGALVPLITFYQEGLDHRKSDDNAKVRDWLKIEFNGELVKIKGKVNKIAKSTKGQLSKGFMDRVIDWAADQGYQIELLNPKDYKYWRDEIFSFKGGPDNYIDYLVELNKLRKIP